MLDTITAPVTRPWLRIRATSRRTKASAFAYAAIALIILGVRLSLIGHFSKPHPFWDAWHVEGAWLYKPFLTGKLDFAALIMPAAEHRPLVLRVYDLSLLALNGQWDVQLQMVVNAILFALLGCLLFSLLSRGAGTLETLVLASAITILLALPTGSENTLNGHHAGWYFFYLFSMLGIWLTLSRAPLSRGWFGGYFCLVLSYLSLFAGVVSIAAAMAGTVFNLIGRRHLTRRDTLAAAMLMFTFVVGMAIQPRFPAQAIVRASSVQAFFTALGYSLSWPYFESSARGLFLQAPALVLGVLVVWRRIAFSTHVCFLLTLALWFWFQAIGIAYARGISGTPPVVRYMDILTIGLLAGLACALMLVKTAQRTISSRLATVALTGVWMVAVAVGLDRRTRDAYAGILPEKQRHSSTQELNLRGFIATGSRIYLDGKSNAEIGYYAGTDVLASYLTDPVIRDVLPSSIREPLQVRWKTQPAPTAVLERDRDPALWSTNMGAGGAGATRFESEWLPPAKRPFLQFHVDGGVDKPGIALQLVTAAGHVTPIRPTTSQTTAEVPSPKELFRLVAVDDNPEAWISFSSPREMGRLSYYAERLVENARVISLIGGTAALLFLVLEISSRNQPMPARRAGGGMATHPDATEAGR